MGRYQTVSERFWGKVIPYNDCLLWVGAKTSGYGQFWYASKLRLAHRVMYEWVRGPIPHGTEIDHTCTLRACVNPNHLEAVSHPENCKRSLTRGYRVARPLFCAHGHPYTGNNRRFDPRGALRCRTCERLRNERNKTPEIRARKAEQYRIRHSSKRCLLSVRGGSHE